MCSHHRDECRDRVGGVVHRGRAGLIGSELISPAVAGYFMNPERQVVEIFTLPIDKFAKCSLRCLLAAIHRLFLEKSGLAQHIDLAGAFDGIHQSVAQLKHLLGVAAEGPGWRHRAIDVLA